MHASSARSTANGSVQDPTSPPRASALAELAASPIPGTPRSPAPGRPRPGASRAVPSRPARWPVLTLLFIVVLAGSAAGLAAGPAPVPTSHARAAPSRDLPAVAPYATPQPYHLRWLGAPQAVLGLGNGYRDTMGDLETSGTAAYTCYMNYSNGRGGNLYLLDNASGSWQATPIGSPLTAGTSNNGPGCWVTTGVWSGKTVTFIAYLSTADDASWNDLSNGISVIYNPSGSLSGPWVNVVAETPGFHNPGGCCISPGSLSDAVYDNATLLIAFQGGWPTWSANSASSVIWVIGIPLSALPTTPGGTATAAWMPAIPDAGDICCGEPSNMPAVNAWVPLIMTGPSKLAVSFVRADATPGGLPQQDIARYAGTVLANGNTTWASSTGGATPDLEATFESAFTTPSFGGGMDGVMLGGGTTFLTTQNASSVPVGSGGNGFMSLTAVWGGATTWQNRTLNEINPGSAVYDTSGVTFGACGITVGDEALVDPAASTAQPAVTTYNNSQWTYQAIGPVNVSNQLPNFLQVAAQGQYLDVLFLNQPGGGASGWTTFYTAQALCTNSTLNNVGVTAAPRSSVAYNGSVDLTAQATDLSGAALYPRDGVQLTWAIAPASLARLNTTSGTAVNLTAASTAGTITVFVNASQYGWISHTTFTVTVVRNTSPSSSGSGGAFPWLPVIAIVIAVAAVGSFLGYRMLKGRRPPTTATPATSSPPASGPTSGPPPVG